MWYEKCITQNNGTKFTKRRLFSKIRLNRLLSVTLAVFMLFQVSGVFGTGTVIASESTVIDVNPYMELGEISPSIFGANSRYFDHGVGMWDPSTDAIKPGFQAVYSDIGFKSMRYPGGTVGNTFDWKKSIGPVEQRGKAVHGHILNLSPQETDFGLDEAARFCEENGTEMVYVYNMGNGNAQDAADLAEYLNAPNDGSNPNGGIDWAAVRAQNGHPEPYNIKSIEIGNEMYFINQRYWMDGTSNTGKSYQAKYAFGDTVDFAAQAVVIDSDWRLSAGTSDGTPSQVKYARFAPVNGDGTIMVGIAKWTRVSDLKAHGAENIYELDNATGKITFGDGINGNIPPKGALITISYTSTHDGYVDYYREIKAVDPSVMVYSCLHDSTFIELMGSTHEYDGVAVHPYSSIPVGIIENYHDEAMVSTDNKANYVRGIMDEIQRTVRPERASQMKLVVSEYGILSDTLTYPPDHYLASLDHGLFVGRSIIDWIEMGLPQAQKHCLIDYTNGDELGPGEQAIISAPDFIATATAKVFKMYTHMTGPTRIASSIVNNPTRKIYTGQTLKKLKVSTSKDNNGNVYILVVNADRADAVTADINLLNYAVNGNAEVWTLNAPSYLSYNTVTEPNKVDITTSTMQAAQSTNYTFPAHSVTAIKLSGTVLTPSETVLPAPVGAWKFDETSGTTAFDSSINGKNGTLTNGATWTPNGKANGAVNFDGADDVVKIPYILNPVTTDFTASAWVKLDESFGSNQTILQQEGIDGRGWLYRLASGRLATYIGGQELMSNSLIMPGQWYQVAAVKEGTTVKLYINGRLESYATRVIESSTGGLKIGRHKNPSSRNEEWAGQIDEMCIYDKALNDNQILELFSQPDLILEAAP